MKMNGWMILFAVIFASTPALAARPKHCVRTPTIECRTGFEVKQVNNCFVCVPEEEEEPLCVKAPTIECRSGFTVAQDAEGCFRCVVFPRR